MKARISVMDGRIHLKYGMGGTYPKGVSTAKMVSFRPAIIELWMRENGVFLVRIKCTLVRRAPSTWLHDTLSCVLMEFSNFQIKFLQTD